MSEPGDLRDLVLHDQDFDLDSLGGATAESLGLGKYVAVGYNGAPTWIDPAADDWADVVANDFGWVQIAYGVFGDKVDFTMGSGDGATGPVNFAVDATGKAFLSFGSVLLVSDADGSVGGVTPSPGDVLTWDGTKIAWATP